MKASELRLGNYVYWNHKDVPFNEFMWTHEITSIGENDVWTKAGWVELKKINPIPITEEWLLNFRFVDENKMFIKSYSRKDDNMVSFLGIFFEEKMNAWIGYVGNNSTNFSVAINCYFSVHQIQNLYFSLTGEEMILKT